MTGPNLVNGGPKITVIFLLYSEANYVPGLFEAVLHQRHPRFERQADWMKVVFVDNGSEDDTLSVIQRHLHQIGSPSHYGIIHHEKNQGISRALNHAFKAVDTPYILTCHCDVLFGRDDYVARMAELLEKHPNAGAIAGQPAIPKKERIPFAEKVNLVANLMDIFPAKAELVPVGFVEGRCDAFRVSALDAAGYYDTTLRLAGEDQVLAARMRAAGFELYQAPDMPYSLSVSSDQDSLLKLIHHQRLFGRAHPYIVLKNQNAVSGIVGKSAGANRQARTILRLTQVLSSMLYFLAIVLAWSGPAWAWLAPLVALIVMKQVLFSRHIREVRFTAGELAKFYFIQPFLDLSYSLGLCHGFWLLVARSNARPIG